jgi:hypothetical protein
MSEKLMDNVTDPVTGSFPAHQVLRHNPRMEALEPAWTVGDIKLHAALQERVLLAGGLTCWLPGSNSATRTPFLQCLVIGDATPDRPQQCSVTGGISVRLPKSDSKGATLWASRTR